jgi:UDP-GlcNAc3NAcA epimerase
MKKVLTVVGARPQFVKAAMLSQALQASGQFVEVIVHTGQHYDPGMSDVFFDQLGIPAPGHALGISGCGHGEMTGRMLCALEPVIIAEAPDIVLVYGDTNSTLAGALTASKLHLPIAHVEAGLRSFNRLMPEEINRVLTDHLSTLLFCPTETSVKNLEAEGINCGVHRVGDIMFDAALHFGNIAKTSLDTAMRYNLTDGKYVLATIHRQENTDDMLKLARIFESLAMLAREVSVVLPLHPRTRGRLDAMGLLNRLVHDRLHIIEPLGYLEMLALEQEASLIVTDSGGVQKEAYFFNVPCLTLRDQTEWVELVDLGWNQLVDVLNADIVDAARRAIGKCGSKSISPYGIGDTAHRIVERLSNELR